MQIIRFFGTFTTFVIERKCLKKTTFIVFDFSLVIFGSVKEEESEWEHCLPDTDPLRESSTLFSQVPRKESQMSASSDVTAVLHVCLAAGVILDERFCVRFSAEKRGS